MMYDAPTSSNNDEKLTINPLSNPLTLLKIKELYNVLLSSYGPNERLKIFENNETGEMTTGSSSKLLLNSSICDLSDSVLSIIVTSFQQHLETHYDFGLYGTLLCLNLVQRALGSNASNLLISECYRDILKILMEYVKNEKNEVVKYIDIGNSKELLDFLSSIIATKSVLQINRQCNEKLARTILKAYLCNMSLDGIQPLWPCIHYVQSNINHLQMCEGLLMDLTHYSQSCIDELDLTINKVMKKGLNVIVFNISLTISHIEESMHLLNNEKSKMKIMLYLKNFVDVVSKNKVSIVFNQRVTDEEVKKTFRDNNIIVIDRIGIKSMSHLLAITGAKELHSISHLGPIKSFQGYIDKISTKTVNSKSFLFIENTNVPMSSLIVPYYHDSILPDIRQVLLSCFNALENVFENRKVFIGGGKLELSLLNYLSSYYRNNCHNIALPLSSFKECVDSFCAALDVLGNQCMKSNNVKEHIFDCFTPKLNAFIIAVNTSCLLLEITYQIID